MAITEKELLLPALYLISKNDKLNTTKLIKSLTELYKPEGHDAEIISGRNDTFFSQKVRNLTGSHYSTNKMSDYTGRDKNGYFSLTQLGTDYLNKHIEDLDYIFNTGFSYKDKANVTNKLSKESANNKLLILDENVTVSEGETKTIQAKVKSRSSQLRDAAIDYFSKTTNGLKCCVCGFDFYKKYGARGKNYIEIHHEKPVSQYEKEDITVTIKEAIKNLKPLCSNCHKMIHRYPKELLSVSELKDIVESEESKNDN